jgi:5-carboxymethyl-2-hydroxymuconate isomerase
MLQKSTIEAAAWSLHKAEKARQQALFAMTGEHFMGYFACRSIALAMECVEFSEAGTWKKNNIHAGCKKS